ncbi:FAR1-related sequence 5-like protein [Tanacetum coccineum]
MHRCLNSGSKCEIDLGVFVFRLGGVLLRACDDGVGCCHVVLFEEFEIWDWVRMNLCFCWDRFWDWVIMNLCLMSLRFGISALNAPPEEIVAYEQESDETQTAKKLDALRTLESFVTHSNFNTLGGTVYYIPKVFADVLLVKGTFYDSFDDCIVAYMKYAAEAGFVVRRSCQKRLRSRVVKQKHSNLHITGCKARVVFNLVRGTTKYKLDVFDTIHNHELEREEYKHLSKIERQLTYAEQLFIVKVASVNIGATRAHHLLTGINGSYLLVHVSKYNYREFCEVVSFDATFKINKYKMVFVPFTVIDNQRKCVTVTISDEIPAIVEFKSKISDVNETEPSLPISESNIHNGTIQELLALGRHRRGDAGIIRCEAKIINVRTKNSWWYYPACGSGKCKKGVTWNDGKLWHSCSKPVNYAKPRFRLEVDVKDESAQTVIVTWDETASELTKSSAKALLDGLDEVDTRARGVTEVSDDDTPEGSNTVSKTLMKQLVRGPQMHTPSRTS